MTLTGATCRRVLKAGAAFAGAPGTRSATSFAAGQDGLTAGFIHVGPKGDFGYDRAHAEGAAAWRDRLEIRAHPSGCLGDFPAPVPPPLSISTIALSDGSTVKGFLAEHAGTDGAGDMSSYGGWCACPRDRPRAPGKWSAGPT